MTAHDDRAGSCGDAFPFSPGPSGRDAWRSILAAVLAVASIMADERTSRANDPPMISIEELQADAEVQRLLDRRCEFRFADAPFREALRQIAAAHFGGRLRMDDAALRSAGIEDSTTVDMIVDGLSLRSLLELLLTTRQLGWFVDGDQLVVTSTEKAGEPIASRSYAVGDLAISYEHIRPDFTPAHTLRKFATDIRKRIEKSSWLESGGQGIIEFSPDNQTMTIRNTERVQRRIVALLRTQRWMSQEAENELGERPPSADANRGREALLHPIRIDVKDLPLRELWRIINDEYTIGISINVGDLQRAEIDLEMPITMHFDGETLDVALRQTLHPLGIRYRATGAVLHISTREGLKENRETIEYPVRTLTEAAADPDESLEQLAELVRIMTAPNEWAENGGDGAIFVNHETGALEIWQTPGAHFEIKQLLGDLETAAKGVSPPPRAFPGLTAAQVQVLDELDQPRLTLRIADVPFHQFARLLADEAEVNLMADYDTFVHRGIPNEYKVDVDFRDASPRKILEELVEPLGLEVTVAGRTVCITSPRRASGRITTAVYSVSSLIRSTPQDPAPFGSVEDVVRYIESQVARETWNELSGWGRMAVRPESMALVVRHAARQHDQIRAELERLAAIPDQETR